MSARIIDGKRLADTIKKQVAQRVARLKDSGISPGLAVVLVGDDPASSIYVRNKAAACEKTGMRSRVIRLPDTTTETGLLSVIHELNHDKSIHGILVQLPVPPHISDQHVIAAINPDKDVDGFHPSSVGRLVTGHPLFQPCTPYGIMKMLESENVSLWGAEVVIVGASNIVGKPMAMLALASGATVTLCNSKTRDLASHTRRADVLIVATGKPDTVIGSMIKSGAVVIDVGMNRNNAGKLVGDVDFESARKIAKAITPVPGGVGPMTIAMLLMNTLEAAERLTKQGPQAT